MHENAARALQYYEDLPRRSGRPELRLVDSEPRTRRREEAAHALLDRDAIGAGPDAIATEPADSGPEVHTITLDPEPAEPRAHAEAPRPAQPHRAEPRRRRADARPRASAPRRGPALARPAFPARRRQTVAPRIAGRPDRVAMWAVLLGFFLTAVAGATGHG